MPELSENSIAALVVCRNEERRISDCLRSLAFCDEIIVVDDFSSDATAELARPLSSVFVQRPFRGCNDQKDFARRTAHSRWVLNIDADEMVSDRLREEILAAVAVPKNYSGFSIPVRTFLGDRWIRHAGFWPNRKKRLFLKDSGGWDASSEPHDRVVLQGRWGGLAEPIEHFTAENIEEMRAKILRRAELAAAQLRRGGLSCGKSEALLRSEWRWLRSFVFERGFLEAGLGLELADLARLECRRKYELLRNAAP